MCSTVRPPVAVGSGFAALDIVIDESGVLLYRDVGGTCANILAALAYLGWISYPVVRLGIDAAAALIMAGFEARGMPNALVVAEPHISSPRVIERLRSKGGRREHQFLLRCPACGAFLPRFTSLRRDQIPALDRLPDARLFLFDRATPATLLLAQRFAQRGALILFEPNTVGEQRLFAQAVAVSHVVKYSAERLARQLPALQHGVAAVADQAPVCEIQTNGKNGVRYRVGSEQAIEWYHLPAYTCTHFVDSTGAGDWFSGGFLHQLLRGGRAIAEVLNRPMVAEAVQWGQALASLKCQLIGARGLTYRVEPTDVEALVAATIATGSASRLRAAPDQQTLCAGDSQLCPVCLLRSEGPT